jgi:hypothetical protein
VRNILVSAGTLCYLADRFATCGDCHYLEASCLLRESDSRCFSPRLRKASCLLKGRAVLPRELLKSSCDVPEW